MLHVHSLWPIVIISRRALVFCPDVRFHVMFWQPPGPLLFGTRGSLFFGKYLYNVVQPGSVFCCHRWARTRLVYLQRPPLSTILLTTQLKCAPTGSTPPDSSFYVRRAPDAFLDPTDRENSSSSELATPRHRRRGVELERRAALRGTMYVQKRPARPKADSMPPSTRCGAMSHSNEPCFLRPRLAVRQSSAIFSFLSEQCIAV